jgi:hypothetical protein
MEMNESEINEIENEDLDHLKVAEAHRAYCDDDIKQKLESMSISTQHNTLIKLANTNIILHSQLNMLKILTDGALSSLMKEVRLNLTL